MSDPKKLVNCGECVHMHEDVCSAENRTTERPVTYGSKKTQTVRNTFLNAGPHDCTQFSPSPLARIADALEVLAKDTQYWADTKATVVKDICEAHGIATPPR